MSNYRIIEQSGKLVKNLVKEERGVFIWNRNKAFSSSTWDDVRNVIYKTWFLLMESWPIYRSTSSLPKYDLRPFTKSQEDFNLTVPYPLQKSSAYCLLNYNGTRILFNMQKCLKVIQAWLQFSSWKTKFLRNGVTTFAMDGMSFSNLLSLEDNNELLWPSKSMNDFLWKEALQH